MYRYDKMWRCEPNTPRGEVDQPVDDDALSSFRGGEAELDDLRDQRIRARLRELTRHQPDEHGRAPFSSTPLSVARPPAPARRRPAHWQYVAASVAVVLAVAVGLAVRLGTGGGGDASTLADLAEVAGTQPTAAFEGFVHEQRHEVGRRGGQRFERTVVSWVDRQGAGVVRYEDQVVVDGDGDRASVSDEGRVAGPGELSVGPVGYEELGSLPADPRELLGALAAAGASTPYQQVDVLARLTAIPVVPAEVRAGALRALELLGGEVAGGGTDRLGRTGVAVVLEVGEGPMVVLVDPATGTALGWRLAAPGGDPSAERDLSASATLLPTSMVAAAPYT